MIISIMLPWKLQCLSWNTVDSRYNKLLRTRESILLYQNFDLSGLQKQYNTEFFNFGTKTITLLWQDFVISVFFIERFHVTSCCPPTGCFHSNGNQYSFMHASFYIIVHNGFFMNFSIRGSSAWISRSVCAIRRPYWRTAWRQWNALSIVYY